MGVTCMKTHPPMYRVWLLGVSHGLQRVGLSRSRAEQAQLMPWCKLCQPSGFLGMCLQAVVKLVERGRLPCNISCINDIMRATDRYGVEKGCLLEPLPSTDTSTASLIRMHLLCRHPTERLHACTCGTCTDYKRAWNFILPVHRSWHFSKAGVNAFRQLADWFEKQGSIKLDVRSATVLITWVTPLHPCFLTCLPLLLLQLDDACSVYRVKALLQQQQQMMMMMYGGAGSAHHSRST